MRGRRAGGTVWVALGSRPGPSAIMSTRWPARLGPGLGFGTGAAEAVTKLSRTKGRDAAIAVLKSFGADKLPDVKAEDYAAVVAKCNAAMGE